MNAEKLAKLQAQVRIGGKGTPRRKVKKVHRTAADDKKLQAALQKLNCQNVGGIEEVNFFRNDTTVVHFAAPKVMASVASNTFVIHGTPEYKNITELMPSIMSQLDLSALSNIRPSAPVPTSTVTSGSAPAGAADDDDVPDLVDAENFDQTD